MLEDSKKEEKLCLFFASDYHFEMISLPYINERLKKDNNIIIMTENNLNGTVNKLIKNLNLKEDEKKEIAKIDWENNDVNKFKEIKEANENGKETVIFVKGRENYISTVNKNINNWIKNNGVKIVDCYDVNEVGGKVSNIVKNYKKILSTSGVEKML